MSSPEDPTGFLGQGKAIVDYVFPIFNVEITGDGLRVTAFLGTGFFIGARGFALTAKHVMRPATTPAILMRDGDQTWCAFAVKEEDPHPSEDVTVLRIEAAAGWQWKSIFALPGGWQGSGMSYFLFGYPESAMLELVENGMALMRPDLIYSEGHIRRRLTDIPLPAIRGAQFFS